MGHFDCPLPRERVLPPLPTTQASVSHPVLPVWVPSPVCSLTLWLQSPTSTSVSPSVTWELGASSPAAPSLAGLVAAVPAPRVQSPVSAPTRLQEPVTSCPAPSKPCWVATPTATSEPWSLWRIPRAARRRRGTPEAGEGLCERGGAGGARPPGLWLPPLTPPHLGRSPRPIPLLFFGDTFCMRVGVGVYCYPRKSHLRQGAEGHTRVMGLQTWTLESRPVRSCLRALCACHCLGEAAAARCPQGFTGTRCYCPHARYSPHSQGWFPSWVINPTLGGDRIVGLCRATFPD